MEKLQVPPLNKVDLSAVNQFQKEACSVKLETWYQSLHPAKQESFLVGGLAGEAGEVVQIYKKVITGDIAKDPFAIQEELGDVLWHVALIADREGLTLEEVMRASLNKFRRRHSHRFEVKEE